MSEEHRAKGAWTTPTLEVLDMKSTAAGENQLLSETMEPEFGVPS